MSKNYLYWYCPDVTLRGTDESSNAVLLSPSRVYDLEAEPFSAFLLENQAVVPVRCRVATVTEFASGQDECGNPVSFFDGEAYRPDLTGEAVSTAQNQITLHLAGSALPDGGPALISTDKRAAFIRYTVLVDLLCTTLAELPDFAANLAYLRSFEESLCDPAMPRPSTTFADDLQEHAKKARLAPGFVLPVSYSSGEGDRLGAVVLGRQLSSSHARFDAQLYLFHADDRPEPGVLLSRRVTWGKGSNEQTRCCPVARIGRQEAFDKNMKIT